MRMGEKRGERVNENAFIVVFVLFREEGEERNREKAQIGQGETCADKPMCIYESVGASLISATSSGPSSVKWSPSSSIVRFSILEICTRPVPPCSSLILMLLLAPLAVVALSTSKSSSFSSASSNVSNWTEDPPSAPMVATEFPRDTLGGKSEKACTSSNVSSERRSLTGVKELWSNSLCDKSLHDFCLSRSSSSNPMRSVKMS
mmetsp:Transcript_33471/g.77129  ORF Transcript_33471/g.77129 Transcript_33471/m.77129 type:complete len:204 (+) Transcript_33471:1680-2291(+)